MTCILFGLFIIYIWQSWTVLHCWILLPHQITYLMVVVWLFLSGILISNIHNNPISIQRLLLISFFIDYKTKPNTMIESFPCWDCCMWALHCCITSLFMFLHQWHYLILFISLNMFLSSARLESNCEGWHSKASRICLLITSWCHHQPLHCISSYLHSKATLMSFAIHSQQVPLIWDRKSVV